MLLNMNGGADGIMPSYQGPQLDLTRTAQWCRVQAIALQGWPAESAAQGQQQRHGRAKGQKKVISSFAKRAMDPRAAAADRVEALARHLHGTHLDGSPQEVSGQTSCGVELSPCSSTVRRSLPRFDSNVLANYIDDLRSMKNEVYEVRLHAAPCTGCRSCVNARPQC